MADILYVEDGYVEPGYVERFIDAGSLNLTVNSSLGSVGGFLASAESQISSTADIQTQYTRIRDVGSSPAKITWDDQVDSWNEWLGITWDSYVTGQHYVGNFDLAVDGNIIKFGSAALDTMAALSASAIKVTISSLDLTSNFSQSAFAQSIRSSNADLNVNASVTALVGFITESAALLSSINSLTADSDRIRNLQSTVIGQFNIDASGNFTASAAGNLSGQFDLHSPTQVLKLFSADLASAANIGVQYTRIRPGLSALSIDAALVANNIKIIDFSSNLISVGSLSAIGLAEYSAIVPLSAIATVHAQGDRRILGSANLQAFDFLLSLGNIIAIDPDFILIVPEETKQYLVLPELRLVTVGQNTRLNIVLPENRGLGVPQETRQEEVL